MAGKRQSAFGKEVRIALINKGMTNRDLARQLGMSDSNISDVISGRNVSERTRRMIAEALGLPEEIIKDQS
jgi:transcriptional regulator with XRE-family HTH domain